MSIHVQQMDVVSTPRAVGARRKRRAGLVEIVVENSDISLAESVVESRTIIPDVGEVFLPAVLKILLATRAKTSLRVAGDRHGRCSHHDHGANQLSYRRVNRPHHS